MSASHHSRAPVRCLPWGVRAAMPVAAVQADPTRAGRLLRRRALTDAEAAAVFAEPELWWPLARHRGLRPTAVRRLLEAWGYVARHQGRRRLRERAPAAVGAALDAVHALSQRHLRWEAPLCRPELERWMRVAAVPRRGRERNDNHARWNALWLLCEVPDLPEAQLLALVDATHVNHALENDRWRFLLGHPLAGPELWRRAMERTAPGLESFAAIARALVTHRVARRHPIVQTWLTTHLDALPVEPQEVLAGWGRRAIRLRAVRQLLARPEGDGLAAAARVLRGRGADLVPHLTQDEVAPLFLSADPQARETGVLAIGRVRATVPPQVPHKDGRGTAPLR